MLLDAGVQHQDGWAFNHFVTGLLADLTSLWQLISNLPGAATWPVTAD